MAGSIRKYGYAKRRRYADGRTAWGALYLIAEHPDVYMSAGTFKTRSEANEAWQEKLGHMRQGLLDDPRNGRMTFSVFCDVFSELMTHQKTNTRRNYRSVIARELLPAFAGTQLCDISYEAIARWVTSLRSRNLSASTIRSYKALLSGMLGTAVKLGYIAHNPALRVMTPKEKPRRIKAATGQDIAAVMAQLPGPIARMMVHLAVQSGCRWGELTELRGGDVLVNPDQTDADYIYVQRAVADAGLLDNPQDDGSRFFVEDTTKSGKDRKIGLSVALSHLLRAYICEQRVGEQDLLFPLSHLKSEWEAANPEPDPVAVAIPENLGRTDPNSRGRTYAHGSLSAYTAGGCKCEWCRRAFALYRAERRAQGLPDRLTQPPSPAPRAANTSDHCPDDWFRKHIWHPALDRAEVSRRLRFHDLRHTHATWLARSSEISVTELKERMGHASLDTTQRYIDEADVVETAAANVIDDILAGSTFQQRRLRAI